MKPNLPTRATWGPWMAVLGVLLALMTGVVLGIPALVAGSQSGGVELLNPPSSGSPVSIEDQNSYAIAPAPGGTVYSDRGDEVVGIGRGEEGLAGTPFGDFEESRGLALTPGGAGVHYPLGNVKMTGGCTLHLNAGIYDINSISLAGNSTLIIDSGPVIFNVVGTGQATPIDFTGGGISNPTFKPGQFEILYAGTGAVKIAGGSQSSAMVFAPNADVAIVGGSDFYGAVLGKTITDTGGTNYHYDRSLQDDFFIVGNYMLSAFTWKKY